MRIHRYSLRSLLVLMALCCFISATYGVVSRRLMQRRDAIKRIEAVGGYISFEESSGKGIKVGGFRAHCGRVLFSDQNAFYEIQEVTLRSIPELTDDELQAVCAFPSLTYLSLESSRVTQQGLSVLKSLPRLKTMCLYKTPITSESGLDAVLSLKHLRYLAVDGATPEDICVRLEKAIGAQALHGVGDDGNLIIIDGRTK